MGCGVPAGIYAHTRVQNEPALKYPPGSHWTFPSIWHMSYLHSPVFQTASTEPTQPSLQHLWQASTSVSLTDYSICFPATNSISRVWQATLRLVYCTPLFSGQSPWPIWSQMSIFHSPLCPSHLCSLLVLPPPTRFSLSFRSANSWEDWCLILPNHSQD